MDVQQMTREDEVALLVARGLTRQEAEDRLASAQRLVVTPGELERKRAELARFQG